MEAIRISLWLFALGVVAGCGRSRPGFEPLEDVGGAGRESAGGENGGTGGRAGSGTTGGVGGRAGSATTGGAGGRAGSGTGGVAGRPVDPSLAPPVLRLPQNGHATGSVWSERARRPGFVWDLQPDVTFELEVDDSCEIGALESCEFPSPEWTGEFSVNDVMPPEGLPVSERAPVGQRYFWRVRSCTSAACSPWSMVRYVDVGRQKSDFDGDGYADVVLPNSGNSALNGRVLVGFGPEPSRRVVVLEDAMRETVPDRFGEVAKPLGDMDGDGFADLLVTASGDLTNPPGSVHVFFGSSTFSDAARRESLRLEGDDDGDRLGSAIPAGDVDADGMQDFVVDSYPPDPWLYRGIFRDVSTTKIPVVRSGEALYGVSAGDVTGDGYSDVLAFSVVRGDNLPGRYDLLRGSLTGLAAPSATAQVDGDGLPVATWAIIGDVNGDGFSDFGYAKHDQADLQASHIEVSLGSETPLLDTAFTWAAGIPDDAQYVDLGGPIPAGDVNGDGFEDSLVAFSRHISDIVQANLYLGGRGARDAPDAVYAFQTGLVLFVSTSFPTGTGDVNGDGFDDVFLYEDFGHTGQLFFGGSALDTVPDDALELPFPGQ